MKKLLILFILFFTFSCNNEEKIPYLIDTKNNFVNNVTKWDQVYYYTHFALDKLNIDGVSVTITHIPQRMVDEFEKQSNQQLNGFIVELSLNRFQILINSNLSVIDLRGVIFHELIHLKQAHSGRLVTCNNQLGVFENEEYYLDYVPYRFRPWEIEAYKYEKYLLSLNDYYKQ